MAKLTANQREFEKQIRRINRLINKVESEGLIFIEPPIETIKPKRVSKARIEELKDTTIKSIRSRAYEIDVSTGELVPYKKPDIRTARKQRLHGVEKQKPTETQPSFLTPEQLYERRVQGARKAQETIKRRMRENPNYAKRITEARKRAIQKAHETIRKRMAEDPEFAKKMHDIWSKNLEKARAKKRSIEPLDIIPPSKPTSQTPEELKKQEIEQTESSPDYQPANATDETLNNMYAILNSAVNKHIADVLIRVADDQVEEEGREAFAKRLSTGNDSYWVLDLATKIAFYESDKQEEIKQSAYTLAYIITQGNVGQFTQDEIISAVNMDFGGYYQ